MRRYGKVRVKLLPFETAWSNKRYRHAIRVMLYTRSNRGVRRSLLTVSTYASQASEALKKALETVERYRKLVMQCPTLGLTDTMRQSLERQANKRFAQVKGKET